MEPDSLIAAPKPKISGLKLSIIIILSALTVAGIAFLCVFLCWYDTPEKALSDAFSKITSAENLQTDGEISLNAPSYSGVDSINADFTIKEKSRTAAELNLALNIPNELVPGLDFKFDATATDKLNAYLRIEGIADFIEDNDLDMYVGPYLDIIKEIDSSWIHFSFDELVDDEDAKTAYLCATDKISDFVYSSKFTDIYSKNAFLTLKKSNKISPKNGGSIYETTLNAKKFVDFYNAVVKSGLIEDVMGCSESTDDFDASSLIQDYDSVDSFAEIPTKTYLEITKLSHELVGFYVQVSEDGASLDLSAKISYPASLNISAPSESKSIKDLVEKITAALSDYFSTPYITDNCMDCIPYEYYPDYDDWDYDDWEYEDWEFDDSDYDFDILQ